MVAVSVQPLVGALLGATVGTHVIHILQTIDTEWNETATEGEEEEEEEKEGGGGGGGHYIFQCCFPQVVNIEPLIMDTLNKGQDKKASL